MGDGRILLRDIVIDLGDGSRWREELEALAPLIATALGMGERETLSYGYSLGNDRGQLTSVRYHRAFSGVPLLWGDVFIEVGKGGRIVEARPASATPIELPTAVPTLSGEAAERIVRERFAAGDLAALEDQLLHHPWVMDRTALEVLAPDDRAWLVWNCSLTVPVPGLGAHVLIDAHTGDVVTSWWFGCFHPGPSFNEMVLPPRQGIPADTPPS
ncbi:hypothetical protein AB0H36_38005 [Kribbella sp. NPDC050820]|uniref:hypothetical protein n=1 Tax=Kribbella sp. NPDC050820 TaxID=3155408 RepID=UPI0033DB497C